uniref:RNase H type-1 domain-containing protein n=1 Tax=Cannabis sativa TaxID=3483 RepID=A0A803PSP3_CANSA
MVLDWAKAFVMHKEDIWSATPRLSPTIPVQVPLTPPTGALKLNVDATLNTYPNTIGVGAVIHNDKGQVVAALAKPIIGNFTSHEIKAKAMFHSLTWVLDVLGDKIFLGP